MKACGGPFEIRIDGPVESRLPGDRRGSFRPFLHLGMRMNHLPRLALATPATGPEPSIASLGWLAGLTERRWRVQHFRSRACPTVTEVVGQVTGLAGRHLDAWLMPEDVCRQLFVQGAQGADFALVEGTLDEPGGPPDVSLARSARGLAAGRRDARPAGGGRAAVPRLGRVPPAPAPRVGRRRLPRRAGGPRRTSSGSGRMVSLMTRRPVLGAIEAFPEVRGGACGRRRASVPCPRSWSTGWGPASSGSPTSRAIRALARSRPFPWTATDPSPCGRRRFRVAYAQDEAFGAYFPDTLETLESLGAELVEFSPIRDEALPESVDLVMIGCGFPDRYADALAENLSLISALRSHVCRGQRIYSEGGGTAYLGRSMILDGRQVPGAGILPFDAELLPNPEPPIPVARTLTRDCWLGPKGTTVRGYKSGRWRLRPGGRSARLPELLRPADRPRTTSSSTIMPSAA